MTPSQDDTAAVAADEMMAEVEAAIARGTVVLIWEDGTRWCYHASVPHPAEEPLSGGERTAAILAGLLTVADGIAGEEMGADARRARWHLQRAAEEVAAWRGRAG